MDPAKKVLYFSNPLYLDYDLSLVKNLSDLIDLHFFLDISPISSKETVLKIEKYNRKSGIFDGTHYDISKLFRDYLPEGKTFLINRSTHRPSISNIILQFKLARHIRRLKPDIIHFNTDFNHNYFLLYFLTKFRIIWTIHDPLPHLDDDSFKENLKRKIFYRFVNNYIILNRDQRSDFVRRYKMHKKNVFISELGIYDYLRSKNPVPQSDSGQPTRGQIKILFFGRITKSKGLIFLLKAFNSIIARNPGTSLIIAGKGYLPDYSAELTQNVTFINRHIENKELARLILDSDFVVCPYIEASQSGVIMTAFAYDKPVIATNIGGLKYYVDNGITGLLIAPGSTDELEKAIEKFINDPELLIQISNNIHKKYHNGISSWKSIALNTIEIYNKAR